MIPAILAGRLLTNDFVFGQALGMESYLFAFWQVSKTIALYIIGFLFLWFVFMSFFRKEPVSLIKNYLPKIILSVVVIHVSWFGIRALVDVSTIGIIATSQITEAVMSDEAKIEVKNVSL